MGFGHLSVNIGVYLASKTTNSVINATSSIAYNNEPEFIIVVAKRLEICPKRSNFDSSGVIKFSTYLRTLARISRVGYTSTLA